MALPTPTPAGQSVEEGRGHRLRRRPRTSPTSRTAMEAPAGCGTRSPSVQPHPELPAFLTGRFAPPPASPELDGTPPFASAIEPPSAAALGSPGPARPASL